MENILKLISDTTIEENYKNIFETLSSELVKLASEDGDSLQVLFHCEDMKQFKDFKLRIITITKNAINNKFKNINSTVSEAIAVSLFDGLAHIVKEANSNIDALKENLKIYSNVIIKSLEQE